MNTLPEKFVEMINNNKWIFAKTYAKTAPHEYIVKYGNDYGHLFAEFAQYIVKHGYKKFFGETEYYYLDYNGYKYWTMDIDLDKTDLINRVSIPIGIF